MSAGDLAFVTLAANPIGGLLIAIPFAVFQLHYPSWRTMLTGVPLAYLQVIAVDLGWSLLVQWPWWGRFLERQRSPRLERLMASGGSFWLTFAATPFAGPWLVMALMRYARVDQRRVALPILLALTCTSMVVIVLCIGVPSLFAH